MPRKIETWEPEEEFWKVMPEGISGNDVNGLGEEEMRRPSPFFWHTPDLHPFGVLQGYVFQNFFGPEDSGPIMKAFRYEPGKPEPDTNPPPVDVATEKVDKTAAEFTAAVKEFALNNDADIVGVAALTPDMVYEGFEIKEKYVIVVGVAHDYEEIKHAPSVPNSGNNRAAVEVAKQYERASVASAKLGNFVRGLGYPAVDYPGPFAKALSMMPAALARDFSGPF
ncbi:MAG: hypothetical protein CMF31_06545 [Kordiimonas sp.]|nr:hypothetical protein [Kordiimonas sp.]|tara:strand:+ start:1946 stop:2617 length:672 start_codon:yes stop_codon:yes gene_type:complete